MSNKATVPDAWDDDWETVADKSTTPQVSEDLSQKKVSSRVTKAQRRAQQAEFNRKLWLEAEGPRETNYFLETRPGAAVPLKNDLKAPPVLLSRKGPSTQPSLTGGVRNLSLNDDDESDDESANAQAPTLEERRAKAAKEREEKQRKYEERRQELFGPPSTTGSGTSSPRDLTPPGSRSGGTTNRGPRGGGRGRGGGGTNMTGSRNQSGNRREGTPKKELYDPNYSAKAESAYLQRKANGGGGGVSRSDSPAAAVAADGLQPIRSPKGPDGSGRGGFGFGPRGGKES